MDVAQTLGVLTLVLYVLVRHVIAPMVKYLMRRKTAVDPERHMERRVGVLEVDLAGLKARVVDFQDLLTQHNEATQALDVKMDVMLTEFQSMRTDFAEAHRLLGERIARAETHIEHLLRRRGHAGV